MNRKKFAQAMKSHNKFAKLEDQIKNMKKVNSLSELEAALNQLAKDEWEKARAIYAWICFNIEYDVEGFFSGNMKGGTAEDFFNRRKAVCAGYSDLFNHLAEKLKLFSVYLTGYAKAYGYRPGKKFTQTDHAWVGVQIDRDWYLMEPTWGSGYLDNNKKFSREYNATWFATDPRLFILNHLPEDSQWQLLPKQISLSEYESKKYWPSYELKNLIKADFSTEEILEILELQNLPQCFGQHCSGLHEKGFNFNEIIKILKNEPNSSEFLYDCQFMKEKGFSTEDLLTLLNHKPKPQNHRHFYGLLKEKGYTTQEILQFLATGPFPENYVFFLGPMNEVGFSTEEIISLLLHKNRPNFYHYISLKKQGFAAQEILKFIEISPLPPNFFFDCLKIKINGFTGNDILELLKQKPYPERYFFRCLKLQEYGFSIDGILAFAKYKSLPECYSVEGLDNPRFIKYPSPPLVSGQSYDFEIEAKGTTRVSLIMNGKFSHLIKQESIFMGSVTAKTGKLMVAILNPNLGDNRFSFAIGFEIK